MRWTRRRLLSAGAVLTGACGAAAAVPLARALESNPHDAEGSAVAGAPGPESGAAKRLSLFNLHTNEKLELAFFRGDGYVADSLAAIEVLLRDYRNGEQHAIDPKLMDYLYDIARHIGVDPAYAVISGYRSPQTNEQLRARSNGVARHSLHMEGRAIDVRLAGVDSANLAARAREMGRGGVGYYQRSDFVHLDTGAFRTWNG